MYKCTSSPCRSLSEVGLEAVETFELTKDYPTRQIAIEGIETFLERARRSINPSILWLVGEWGEGKTAVYHGLLRNRRDVYSIYIVASRLFDYMEKILEEQRIWAPNAFLISLLRTLRDSYDEYSELFTELDEVDLTRSLPALLVKLYTYVKEKTGGEPIIVVFIDEFEDVISRLATGRGVQLLSAILEALVELVNGNVEALLKAELQDKIHFIVATTSSAERVLETRLEVSDIWGRLKRRFTRIEFTRMLSIEVLDHLLKLIDYVYCGENLGYKHVAEPPTLLNFAQISSIGLPAATERLVNQLSSILSSRGKIRCDSGSEKLTLDNAFEVLRMLRTVVEGEEEQVLIEDNYLLERRNCIELLKAYLGDKEYVEPLCSLILLSRGGLRIEDLAEIAGGVNEARRVLTVLEHMGLAYSGRGLRVREGIVGFLNTVRIILADLKEKYLEGIVGVIKSTGLWESIELYRLLLDHLVYIGSDGSIIFFKPSSQEVLRKLYVELGGLDEITASRLAELAEELYINLLREGVLEDYGDVIVVDYGVQNHIFFSQEIAALDFISSRDERVRLWRRARTGKNPESFLKGILIPVLDVLRGYFTGGSKNDLYGVRLWKINDEYPIASIEIIAGYRGGKPYPIRELRAEYTPKLRVDVLVVTGGIRPTLLEEYYKVIRSKPLYNRPHVVIVFSTGVLHRRIEELKDLLERIGVVLLSYPIKTIDYLRLSALGLFGEERWGSNIQGYINSMLDALKGVGEGVPGLNTYAYQAYIVTRFEREYGLDGLVDRIDEELRMQGTLIPLPRRSLRVGSKELGVSDLYDSARSLRWIVHYPAPIENVSLKELFEYVTDNVRRHLVFGIRYRDVVGLDLESPDELANKLAPLVDYDLIELREDGEDYRITLKLGESKIVRRLVSILEDGDVEISKVLEAYVVKSDSPDMALGVFFESLKSLNIISIEEDYITPTIRYDKLELKLKELGKLLEEYMEHYGGLHDKLGYIASGKVRHNPPWNPGYRYTYTPLLVSQIKEIIDQVERMLKPNASLELCFELARRMASAERILVDIVYHGPRGEENLRYHSVIIDMANKEFKTITRLLEGIDKELNDTVEQLQRLLVDHVFEEEIRVENKLSERIKEILEKVRELYDKVYDVEEYASRIRGLWSKLPGREFPFYFRSQVYYYNYKVYELVELLRNYEDIVAIDLSKKVPERYTRSQTISDIINEAQELVNVISSTMEQLISINESYKRLRKRILRLQVLIDRYGETVLEEVLPRSIVQFSKYRPGKKVFTIDVDVGLSGIHEEIDGWRKSIGFGEEEDPSKIITRLERLVDEIDKLYDSIVGYASRIIELVDDVHKLVASTSISRDKEVATVLAELENESNRTRNLLEELKKPRDIGLRHLSLNMLRSLLEELRVELRNTRRIVNDSYNAVMGGLDKLKDILASRIRDSVNVVERLLPSIKGIAGRIGGEIASLYRELSSLATSSHSVLSELREAELSSTPKYLELLGKALRIYDDIIRLDVDSIRRKVLESLKGSGLDEDERIIVDVLLRATMEGRERISLRELLARARETLGAEKALNAFYKLVEKGLIDAEIII